MSWRGFIFDVLVALLIFLVVTSPVSCVMHRQSLTADLIKSGQDPVLSWCAMQNEMRQSDLQLCTARAQVR